MLKNTKVLAAAALAWGCRSAAPPRRAGSTQRDARGPDRPTATASR